MAEKETISYKSLTYGEVVGSFTHTAKTPDIALFGKLPISNKVSMGINDSGIWLWHIDYKGLFSLRIFPDNCQLGFFEWKWIREIVVSFSQRMAFIFFYDIDAVIAGAVPEESREQVMKRFVIKYGNEKVIRFPLTSDRHFSVLDRVLFHNYTSVYHIE